METRLRWLRRDSARHHTQRSRQRKCRPGKPPLVASPTCPAQPLPHANEPTALRGSCLKIADDRLSVHYAVTLNSEIDPLTVLGHLGFLRLSPSLTPVSPRSTSGPGKPPLAASWTCSGRSRRRVGQFRVAERPDDLIALHNVILEDVRRQFWLFQVPSFCFARAHSTKLTAISPTKALASTRRIVGNRKPVPRRSPTCSSASSIAMIMPSTMKTQLRVRGSLRVATPSQNKPIEAAKGIT